MFDKKLCGRMCLDFREEKKVLGYMFYDEVARNIRKIVNIYGVTENTYTAYDKQPEVDPVVGCISKSVAVLVKDGRVLHGCYYSSKEGIWYYRGKVMDESQIIVWWYEENIFYEI